jgi:hypothetical protein
MVGGEQPHTGFTSTCAGKPARCVPSPTLSPARRLAGAEVEPTPRGGGSHELTIRGGLIVASPTDRWPTPSHLRGPGRGLRPRLTGRSSRLGPARAVELPPARAMRPRASTITIRNVLSYCKQHCKWCPFKSGRGLMSLRKTLLRTPCITRRFPSRGLAHKMWSPVMSE